MSTVAKYIEVGNHPERQKDEVFLGNCSKDFFGLPCKWKTARMGKQAFDSRGKSVRNIFPLFVKRKEMEEDGYTIVDKIHFLPFT